MEATILMYFFVALIGASISYLSFRFSKDRKIAKDATVLATIETKLDHIIAEVGVIKRDVKMQEKINSELTERVAKVEESAKQAHKRITELKESV